MPARQRPKKRRAARLDREKHRHGTPRQGHGWAAKQWSRHASGGRSASVRKVRYRSTVS
jgi:hypothetical protein